MKKRCSRCHTSRWMSKCAIGICTICVSRMRKRNMLPGGSSALPGAVQICGASLVWARKKCACTGFPGHWSHLCRKERFRRAQATHSSAAGAKLGLSAITSPARPWGTCCTTTNLASATQSRPGWAAELSQRFMSSQITLEEKSPIKG